MSTNVTANRIRYEFDETPELGATKCVAPGLLWLRMPLPFALSHINLWLLEDGDGWAVVDTGVSTDECKNVWNNTFDAVLGDRPVSRVFATHLHPDHIGCVGWIARKFSAPLWMSRSEYLLARVLIADTGRSTPVEGDHFYLGAGFAADQLSFYHKMFGMFGKFAEPLPESYCRMQHGETIDIGEYQWQIVVGMGHSPEHVCFYNEKLNVLISGDQLLPTISSNVSVFPTEPDANPLHDWIESLALIKQAVPDDVLVLPAHGKPFRGAHVRLDELVSEQFESLDALLRVCANPKRAVDVFPALFKRPIDHSNLIMATGESVAHLNYLVKEGQLSVTTDNDGVKWYESV